MRKFEISFILKTDDNWLNEDVKYMVEAIAEPIYHLGDVFVGEVNVEEIKNEVAEWKLKTF